jgi:hypothetical protein
VRAAGEPRRSLSERALDVRGVSSLGDDFVAESFEKRLGQICEGDPEVEVDHMHAYLAGAQPRDLIGRHGPTLGRNDLG